MQTTTRTRQAKLNNYRTIYQQAWQTMRIQRKFTVLDIVPTINTTVADDKLYTIINRYLRGLRRHSHINKTGHSQQKQQSVGARQAYQIVNDLVEAPIKCPICKTRITQGRPCKKEGLSAEALAKEEVAQ